MNIKNILTLMRFITHTQVKILQTSRFNIDWYANYQYILYPYRKIQSVFKFTNWSPTKTHGCNEEETKIR